MIRIALVVEIEDLNPEHLIKYIEGNFDGVFDSRYCLYKGKLWSAFVHPLSDLSEELFFAAARQVVALVQNYGSSYSSGELKFGGSSY